MDNERSPSCCGGIRALSWVLCRVCFLVRAFLCAPGRWCAWIARYVLGKREKVRPARQKLLVFGVFGLAGRVFSRFGLDGGVVGRTFSRFGKGGTMQVVLCVRAGPVVRVDCSLRVGEARKSSPCGVIRTGKRKKVRPAWQKWSVFGVFELAGRVFRGLA